MRTCFQTLSHKLKSVVVLAPQAEERRGKCTWRTMKKRCEPFFATCSIAAPLLLHCVNNLAPHAEERRGETTRLGAQTPVLRARSASRRARGRAGRRTSHHKLNSVVVYLDDQLNHGRTRIQLASTVCASLNTGTLRQSKLMGSRGGRRLSAYALFDGSSFFHSVPVEQNASFA